MLKKSIKALLAVAFLHNVCDVRAEVIESNGFRYAIEPPPAWVEINTADQAFSAGDPKTGAVYYRLIEQQLNFQSPQRQKYFRMLLMPLTEKGLEEVSELEIDFSPDYESLTLHSLKVRRNGELLDKLSDAEIKLVQRERDIERRMYNGLVTAFIILSDIRVGDKIEYTYTRSGANPVFGEKYFDYFTLAWSEPIEQLDIRVVTDANKNLYYRQTGFDEKPVVKRGATSTEYRWQRRDVPAIYDEGEYPRWYIPYPRLEISEYRSWQEVREWAEPLYQVSAPLTAELRAKIQALKSTAPNKQDYIVQALRFTQDEIRYFGVEYGQNSHRPSHPNDVFARRYGDCKDKSLFLVSVLKENGIKAYPALVSARHTKAVQTFLPAPGAFDHVIVYAELDGQAYWLDPTLNYQRGTLRTLGQLDYRSALLIAANESAFREIALEDSNTGVRIERHYRLEDYRMPAALTVETEYRGIEAENVRRALAVNGMEKFSKNYFDFRSRYHPSLEIEKPLSLNDDKKNNLVQIQEQYKIKDFAKDMESAYAINLYADFIGQYTKLPNTVQRDMPLGLRYPAHVQENLFLHYPSDVQWRLDFAPLAITDDAVRYEREMQVQGRRLSIRHRYVAESDHVPVSQVARHIENLKKIEDAVYHGLEVGKDAEDMSRERRLNKVLRDLLNKKRAEQ